MLSKDATHLMLSALRDRELILRLYRNDLVPTRETRHEEMMEVVGGGYEAAPMPPSVWNLLHEDGEAPLQGPVTVLTASHEFRFTYSVGKVYGYYVTDRFGKMLLVERFPGEPCVINEDFRSLEVIVELFM